MVSFIFRGILISLMKWTPFDKVDVEERPAVKLETEITVKLHFFSSPNPKCYRDRKASDNKAKLKIPHK